MTDLADHTTDPRVLRTGNVTYEARKGAPEPFRGARFFRNDGEWEVWLHGAATRSDDHHGYATLDDAITSTLGAN